MPGDRGGSEVEQLATDNDPITKEEFLARSKAQPGFADSAGHYPGHGIKPA